MMADPAAIKYYDQADRHVPGRRSPRNWAGTIVLPALDDASYVTSATLLADGGFIVNAEL